MRSDSEPGVDTIDSTSKMVKVGVENSSSGYDLYIRILFSKSVFFHYFTLMGKKVVFWSKVVFGGCFGPSVR